MKITDTQLRRLSARVGSALLAAGHTVACAESCTGGWIAKALTDIAGSSRWFAEGFVTYDNEAKIRRLGVPRSLLEKDGAVSEAAVRAMASGALDRSDAAIAVAVSGIAGPSGATPGKPVGTVWICWAVRRGRGIEALTELRHFRGNRDEVRRKTVRLALQGLLGR